MKSSTCFRSLCAAGAFALSLCAQAVTINATDRGFYDSTGSHDFSNTNYFTGEPLFGNNSRNFFIFDLAPVSGTVTAATLRLFNPLGSYTSPDPTENYDVHHVGTSPASLAAGTAGAAGFTDLGDGTVYGGHLASALDNGTFINIALNAAAIADINAQLGGLFATGGNLTTLTLDGVPESLFGATGGSALSNTQLILTTAAAVPEPVPEPGSLALLSLGVALALASRRRRQKA